jgi:hypothetical protein
MGSVNVVRLLSIMLVWVAYTDLPERTYENHHQTIALYFANPIPSWVRDVDAFTHRPGCDAEMNVQQLREWAKVRARVTLQSGNNLNIDEMIDAIIDAAVKAAVVEIIQNYQVDVPNTGYFGVIVKK